jgi:hypothetical protein
MSESGGGFRHAEAGGHSEATGKSVMSPWFWGSELKLPGADRPEAEYGMQRIYRSPWTPEEYESQEGWRQVIPESTCSNCHQAVTLHRHDRYQRWVVTLVGRLLYLWIARFFCPLCRSLFQKFTGPRSV